MRPKINWPKVTKFEAEKIIEQANKRLADIKLEARDTVRARAEKMAAEAGFDVRDLFNAKRKHKKKARIYHPTDKTKSYGGYGPKPDWLRELNDA